MKCTCVCHFKATHFLSDTLKQLFPSTSNKDILSRLSRWLSGAPDRDDGRKERMTRNNIT